MDETTRTRAAKVLAPNDLVPGNEPYYERVADEIEHFSAASECHVPILLEDPTGCGKRRFVEHTTWRLKRPLVSVSCHDDLRASDLVGRQLITVAWPTRPCARISVRRIVQTRSARTSPRPSPPS